MHDREATAAAQGGPVSGANAVVRGKDARVQASTPPILDANRDAHTILDLPSLSLRNKNKAKNFRSLLNRPLPAKIIFGDQEGDTSAPTSGPMSESQTPGGDLSKRQVPRLIPPSLRPSLPANMFVTSIDVEAGLQREKRKGRIRIEYGDELEEKIECEVEDVTLSVETAESEVDVDGLGSIADKEWDTLEKLTREKIKPGMTVGYKVRVTTDMD